MRLSALVAVTLTLTAAAGASADDGLVNNENITLVKPAALAVHDQLTITTKTTLTRGSGKTLKTAVRSEAFRLEIAGLDAKKRVSSARIKYGTPTVSGTWPTLSLSTFEELWFKVDFAAEVGHQVVLDAGDGVAHDDKWEPLVARNRWLTRGLPLQASLAGKTFTAGTTVALGVDEIGDLWSGQNGHLSGASITFQKLDAGLATFTITASMTLIRENDNVSGVVTGALVVDNGSGMLKSMTLAGDLVSDASADVVLHVAQTQQFTRESGS